MRVLWLRTALLIGASLVAGLLVWPVLGHDWALAAVAIGLALALIRHVAHLQSLVVWLRDPLTQQVPVGSGAWEYVFSALYRYVRTTSQHQHRLTGQLARFRSAGQAMPDGVIVLDAEDRIVWSNNTAERWFGLDGKKDISQPVVNLVRNPDLVTYLKRGDFTEPLILQLIRGEELVLSLRVVPYGQDEKLLLSRDVTQAEKLETMRRDFVANVSHELKTPLTVVSGFLETLADGTVKLRETRGQQVMTLMRTQTDRMLRLIDDLLTLSTLESTSGPSSESWIDVGNLVRGVHEEAKLLSGGRHTVALHLEAAASLLGNEHELRGAFMNLVSNAVRYTPPDGRISLQFQKRGSEGVFSVEDTGIGVEGRHIPRLTERFYRVDTSRSRDTGGTGLGLAIVKHVLTRHQAHLEVQSELGRGSRFSVVFPERRLRPAAPVSVLGPTLPPRVATGAIVPAEAQASIEKLARS